MPRTDTGQARPPRCPGMLVDSVSWLSDNHSNSFTGRTFAILFGFGLGGDYMIIPLITAEIFDARLLGRLLGVILTSGGIAEAVAPWIVGHIRDVTGRYSKGFLVLIAMPLLGAVVVAFLPKQAVRA